MWDAARYLAFADHRMRPAADLLARVGLVDPNTVVDLGCGPGNSTALLAARWPPAHLVGVDSSPDMLAKARASNVQAEWLQADIAHWRPDAPPDLIYSNATLQWLSDHTRLLPRLLDCLRPAGVLAVQMPRNFAAPSHALMRETATEGPWAGRLADILHVEPVAEPAWYYDLLAPVSATLDVWETEYLHALDGDDPVLRWTRSTALRPVIDALDADELAAFEAAYAAKLRAAYPRRADSRTLFPFRRLFIVAARA